MKNGVITKIIGVVIDVRFNAGEVPAIYDAIEVQGHSEKLTLEVQQQLGDGVVRTIAMGAVDGLKRGLEVSSTGAPITVPVGE
jgi:F-type H+-transporting ATPase subunit beta